MFDHVGMIADQVGGDLAGHPVGEEKLEGFHYRQLHASSFGVGEVAFIHRPELEVVGVAVGVAPEFPFPVLLRGH